ncbi:MAG: glycoside hydrolase family 28 protein, partial [Phycisphaerae bacterium]
NCTIETRYFSPGWWGRAEPIYVTAIHRAKETELGRVRNVRFSNCLCRSENGVFIAGSEDSLIEDLVLDNVRVEIDKWSKWPGGVHDRRPCMVNDTSFGIDWCKDEGITEHPTAGVYVQHARNTLLRNVEVVWGENTQDYWGHALDAENAPGLRLEGFRGEAGKPGLDAQKIE